MIAGNPIRARGVRVLLALVFILLVILTILLLAREAIAIDSCERPTVAYHRLCAATVFVQHLSAS
jgi:hypothetical protein